VEEASEGGVQMKELVAITCNENGVVCTNGADYNSSRCGDYVISVDAIKSGENGTCCVSIFERQEQVFRGAIEDLVKIINKGSAE
jgi:hypothetical protein